jgi:hypothetical protein
MRAPSLALLILTAAAGTAAAAGPVSVPLFTPGTNAMPAHMRAPDPGPRPGGGWVVIEDGTAPGGRALAQLGDAAGRTKLAVYQGLVAANLRASVRVNLVGGATERAAGLAVRVADAGTFDAGTFDAAWADMTRRTVGLYRVRGGVATTLGEAAVAVESGRWYRLGLAADGDRLVVSLDGADVLAVADPAPAAAGGVALLTRGDSVAVFDALVITAAD